MIREQTGAVRLHVSQVSLYLAVLSKCNDKRLIISAWRHQIDLATRILSDAKSNQIDGYVVVDEKDISIVFGVLFSLVDWFGDVIFDILSGGES